MLFCQKKIKGKNFEKEKKFQWNKMFNKIELLAGSFKKGLKLYLESL